MAANPLLACTSNCEVAQVLSDIPFISVGILALGALGLFLVMKRVSLSVVFLFCSALLAFVASVLDLSRILAGGLAINTVFVASDHTTQAREVLFALSIGFRFLFYWSYVAGPSRRDPPATAAQGVLKLPIFETTCEPHGGSWARWGLPGKLAAAGLLFTIVLITALQIVWRVVPQFRQYGNIYATDAALELLVSFLLLLKLLSNTTTLGSVDSMLVHTFSEHLVPIFGLLFNIAIGVGDLLRFAFTESMVGRLLQALEVFVIVVFVMVAASLRNRDIFLFAPSQDTKRGDAIFTLPEPVRGSVFRITPPLIETPRMSTVSGLGSPGPTKESRRELLHGFSARRSLNRVSPWLSLKIPRRRSRHEDDEVKLWNAGKVKGDSTYTGDMDAEPHETSTQASKGRTGGVYDASANYVPTQPALDAMAGPTEYPSPNGKPLHTSRLGVPQRTTPQVRTSQVRFSPAPSPVSEAKHVGNMTITPETSPVYGLGGTQQIASPCGSWTSIDDLMRRQSQLVRNIEALKSFSSGTVPNDRSVQLTRSPSIGQKTVCSDVSLSNFPIPPWPTAQIPSLPPASSSPIQRIRGDRRVLLAAARGQDVHVLAPPRTLVSPVDILDSPRFDSVPHTPTGEENEPLSAEAGKSCGMQYNVTSFIDDLATPGGSRQSQEKSWWPAENESDVGTSSDTRKFTLPLQLEKLPSKPSPLAHSSRFSQGSTADEHASVMNHTSFPLAIIPQISVTDSGLPTRSQPIQDSRSTEGEERAQKMFVRRRPARLSIQPYNPAIPQAQPVQVLDDS